MPLRRVTDIPDWCLTCGRTHLLGRGEVWLPLACPICRQEGQSCDPTARDGLCDDCWQEKTP